MTIEREDGMIRVVARADNHLILGIQAVGVGISELSSSFAQAVEMGQDWKTSPVRSTHIRH